MTARRTARTFTLFAATALSTILASGVSAPAAASGVVILPTSGVVAQVLSSVLEANILMAWSGVVILPTSG
jgi:hypothetical protein